MNAVAFFILTACAVASFLYQANQRHVTFWLPAVVALFTMFACIVVVSFNKFKTAAQQGQWAVPKWDSRYISYLLLLLSSLLFQLAFILIHPLWLSEALIIDDALNINDGIFPNPFSASGDFPNKFFSYLVALLTPMVTDPRLATRLLGVWSSLFFFVMLLGVLRLYLQKLSAVILVFPICSIWLTNLSNTADNNWLSMVPLLSIAPFFLLLLLKSEPGIRQALIPLLAGSFAICFSTLYMPAVAGLAVFFLLLFDRDIHARDKAAVCWWTLPLCAPLFGQLWANPGGSLGRHVQYVTQTGEGDLQRSLLEGYLFTLERLWDLVYPDFQQSLNPNRSLFLEPTAIFFLLMGVLVLFLMRGEYKRPLIAFSLFCLIGLVLSNPLGSLWRTTVLAPSIYIFIGLGAGYIHQNLSRIRGILFSVFCLAAHGGLFAYYYFYQIQRQESPGSVSAERFAVNSFYQCLRSLRPPAKIEVFNDYPTFTPRILSRNRFSENSLGNRRFIEISAGDQEAPNLYEIIRFHRNAPTAPEETTDAVCMITGAQGDLQGVLRKRAP